MRTLNIDIKTSDGICDAYLAYPSEGKEFPAVILFPDAFGPRLSIYEMAQIMAGHGYYVLVPNLFYRERHVPITSAQFPVKRQDLPEIRKQFMPLLQNLDSKMKKRDVGDWLKFLSEQKEVSFGKVATTGYCMGGNLSLCAAAWYPEKIAAAASFHGAWLASDAPDSPHRMASQIQAELYIAHADNDPLMTPEQIETLDRALDQASVKYKSEVYKGAEHGFSMADLPSYNADALKRHWDNLLALLESHLDPSHK